jgi:hypothetical protein
LGYDASKEYWINAARFEPRNIALRRKFTAIAGGRDLATEIKAIRINQTFVVNLRGR